MSSRKGGIANWSMRKLGTPIGAGPKSAIVRVGLAFVGTPSGARVGGSEGLRPSSDAFDAAAAVARRRGLRGRPIRWDRPGPAPPPPPA